MSSIELSPPHLDREFLPIRAKILEIAAALDRIERATFVDTGLLDTGLLDAGLVVAGPDAGEPAEDQPAIPRHHADDPRWNQLQAGIQLLLTGQAQRAEQVQLLFSRPYDEQWRQNLEMAE